MSERAQEESINPVVNDIETGLAATTIKERVASKLQQCYKKAARRDESRPLSEVRPFSWGHRVMNRGST